MLDNCIKFTCSNFNSLGSLILNQKAKSGIIQFNVSVVSSGQPFFCDIIIGVQKNILIFAFCKQE